jgi:hypothetical protein
MSANAFWTNIWKLWIAKDHHRRRLEMKTRNGEENEKRRIAE